jgi:hypothetical protein
VLARNLRMLKYKRRDHHSPGKRWDRKLKPSEQQ